MAVAEAPVRAATASGRGATRGRAFGLELEADYELPALAPSAGQRLPRRTACRNVTAAELEAELPRDGWTADVDLRHPDGRLFLGVAHHPEAGYRIWAPRYGRHVVSADGRLIRSALPERSRLGWQRLFFAQALPLAAVLQGLEVLHASGVALDGQAIAFTAASGSGKSSLAAHLVASGATFLTDDVLALEETGGRPLAHPGAARASVASHELRAMDAAGRARLGRRIGTSDKPHFATPTASESLPLAALYRLRRGSAVDTVRICEHVPPEPRLVLASSFLPYVRTSARLLNQLATCASVTSFVRIFDVELPASITARAAADTVLDHLQREVVR